MDYEREERTLRICSYMIEHKATVREVAAKFGVSKSNAHKDVTERIKQINPQMAVEVRKVLDTNKRERHIRGGIATKIKFAMLKSID